MDLAVVRQSESHHQQVLRSLFSALSQCQPVLVEATDP